MPDWGDRYLFSEPALQSLLVQCWSGMGEWGTGKQGLYVLQLHAE